MSVSCEVCKEVVSKYKCSTCFCPYCSLNCWKKHKGGDECKAKENVEEKDNLLKPTNKTKYFTEDTVSEDKLKQLRDSKTLKDILGNRYLQNMLIAVDNASDPKDAINQAMKHPEFVEFVDECLKIVEGGDD